MENEERTEKTSGEQSIGFPAPEKQDAAPDNVKTGNGESPAGKRYLLDIIGDFFEKMTIGILKFAFIKLPSFVWRLIRERLRGLLRAVFWCTLWLFIICAAWGMAAWKAFLDFWLNVWASLQELLVCVKDNIGMIWFFIAMIGSVYGLLYVTRKWREQMKSRLAGGMFSFLRRRQKKLPPHEESGIRRR